MITYTFTRMKAKYVLYLLCIFFSHFCETCLFPCTH